MRLVKLSVCLSLLALGTSAYAQDDQEATPPPEGTPAPAPAPAPAATATATGTGAGAGSYMGPEINRPLTLPAGGIEGELAIPIQRFSVTVTDPFTGTSISSSTTGESLALGARYGVMPNLTAGGMLAFQLNPDATLSNFLVNGEYELMPGSMMMAAARADLGVTHASAGMTSSTAFDLGLGAPFKYSITPMLSFISGSQYEIMAFGFLPTQDILFFEFGDTTTVGLNIPVGVLAQITPMIAAQFRTGYALVHSGDASQSFVPINIDLITNLNAGGVGIDPYFTFSIAGLTDDYTSIMNFLIGARVHL